jgi:hypothetical protein
MSEDNIVQIDQLLLWLNINLSWAIYTLSRCPINKACPQQVEHYVGSKAHITFQHTSEVFFHAFMDSIDTDQWTSSLSAVVEVSSPEFHCTCDLLVHCGGLGLVEAMFLCL